MIHDGIIDIATGLSASTKKWKNKKVKWSKLIDKLSKPVVTNETHAQFMAANKADQSKIKDVGGFVGGYLDKGIRKKASVSYRQLICLDIDFSYADFWWDFTLQYGCAAAIYSTHKSTQSKPRHRLLIPINREVSVDEYQAISRRIAGNLNIELFDQSTFEPERLMFWPSVSSDIEYYFEYQDGEWLDADAVLETYDDWRNTSEWPSSSKISEGLLSDIKKQEDPEEKSGIIGTFCRTYSIQDAISTFLSDVYEEAGEDRYTYKLGSTTGGLIIYNDKFAFSHHGTDPASGRLCNAFDLVRIHKFGHLDSGPDSKVSQQKMEEFATTCAEVKKKIAEENLEHAKLDFDGLDAANEERADDDSYDDSWLSQLKANKKGEYDSDSNNLNLVLQNDKYLRGAFRLNEFDSKTYIMRSMPWRKVDSPEPVKNVDYSGIRNYIECVYNMVSVSKIDDAVMLAAQKKSFHPVRDYLKSLSWDGVNRIDTLLIDYFGAEDTTYTRATIRKALCAAVARIFNPGTKYDMVLVLVGAQATYKSTFIRKLGKDWFSDSFSTFQGKEAYEQLQGAWLIEMAELSGLKKAEVETVKQFITKTEDMFRPAYGRTVETYKRQCVFFGTTNDMEFLRDSTGNRRFNPIEVRPKFATKIVAKDLTEDTIDQIWAEAVQMYQNGEKLYFSEEENELAKKSQQSHSVTDDRTGIIEEYLNMKFPSSWNKKDLFERQQWLNDPLAEKGTEYKEFVCSYEIWCECLGEERKNFNSYSTREINNIMKTLPGWEYVGSKRKSFGKIYGKQKYYKRIKLVQEDPVAKAMKELEELLGDKPTDDEIKAMLGDLY